MEKTTSADIESVDKNAHGGEVSTSDQRLRELGYRVEFRRDMSLFGVLGISFCAIGILTGMSSAFQTGLFSGGPLGLFWGWNVCPSSLLVPFSSCHETPLRSAVCSCCSLRCLWLRSVVHSECNPYGSCSLLLSNLPPKPYYGRLVFLGVQNEARRSDAWL